MDAAAAGVIYVVATPIGNLDDITLRAIRVLGEVDLVAAEDTRRARILLQHLGLEKRVVSYYDAIESRRASELVERAQRGASIALVSDAGTPLVADPGYRLVAAAIDAGIQVIPIPGPSAPTAFLSVSGLPTGRFTFVGFLPARASGRRRELAQLAARGETLLFFETARRLRATLADMSEILGVRRAAIGRELTKRFEEILRGTLPELAQSIAERCERGEIKGEVVVGVAGCGDGGPGRAPAADAAAARSGVEGAVVSADEAGAPPALDAALAARLAAGESVPAAARAVAALLGLPRREVYRRAVELRGQSRDP